MLVHRYVCSATSKNEQKIDTIFRWPILYSFLSTLTYRSTLSCQHFSFVLCPPGCAPCMAWWPGKVSLQGPGNKVGEADWLKRWKGDLSIRVDKEMVQKCMKLHLQTS